MSDINFKIDNWNKILKAAIHNDIEFIRNLKNFYPELHWKSVKQLKTGDTALHYAADNGFIDLVIYLVCFFDPKVIDIKSFDSRTPLHCAAQSSRYRVVEYLLNNGADINALKRSDWTPVMLACTKSGYDALKTVQVFIKHKAILSYKNKDGWTALMLACREGDLPIVLLLIDAHPPALRLSSKNKRTPLHTACLHGHLKIVQEIFSRLSGIPNILNEKDACGSTPFHESILSGNLELVQYMVKIGANIREINNEGWNALHIAASVGKNDIVEYLITELNFEPNCLTNGRNKLTPLHCAGRSKCIDTMQLLIRLNADKTICDWQGRPADSYLISLN